MSHRIALVLAVAIAVAAVASPAAAVNLVPNPTFDAGVGGWSTLLGTVHQIGWSPQDEGGKPTSGALRVTNAAPDTAPRVNSACFAVTPGASIAFGASAWSPPAAGQWIGRAELRFFSDASCVTIVHEGGELDADLHAKLGGQTWGPIQGFGLVPPTAIRASLRLIHGTGITPPGEVLFDNAFVVEGATCVDGSRVACLGDGRFRVDIEWTTAEGSGHATMRPFAVGGDSAWSTFFSPTNVEAVIKVLDGCAINNRYWIFAAGLTNVGAMLSVKDTVGGPIWTFVNGQQEAFQPIQETSAFATCP